VNKADSDGFPELMLASYWGHVEVVRLLLAHPDVEADRTSTDGRHHGRRRDSS
jgi:hypothetical protein